MAFDISFSEKIKKNTKEQKIKTHRRCSQIQEQKMVVLLFQMKYINFIKIILTE